MSSASLPDFPASDRAAMPAGWQDSLRWFGADDATLASIEAAAGRAGPAVPGRVARAEHSLVTVLTPAGPARPACRGASRPAPVTTS